VIVEVDGGQHADEVSYDAERTRWLEAQGYRVLRFWNNDVLANTEAVAQAILNAVERGTCPPTSILPRKGGGGSARCLDQAKRAASIKLNGLPQSSPATGRKSGRYFFSARPISVRNWVSSACCVTR
jgi:hypothetical protein